MQEAVRLRVLRLHDGLRAAAAARTARARSRRATRSCSRTCGCGTSGERLLPVDHDARERARRDHATSFVLEAGAGTGKTTLLVDRIEALVRRGRGAARRRSPP